MENKLEQLLNSLIEKGWEPFGKNNRGNVTIDKTIETKSPFFDFDYHNMSVSTRELISKESGLWQFVCDNGMVKGRIKIEDYPAPRENKKIPTYKEWTKQQRGEGKQGDCIGAYSIDNYGYRIIESALKDESELESFILDNIKL